MDLNTKQIQDGDSTLSPCPQAPSIDVPKQKVESMKKKRRRGKTKRKIMKPYSKLPWQDRRNNGKSKRNNRFRKIVLSKTQAPFNNNQFLMEIHKPEPENHFHMSQTPSARTRDSSFSIDSDENYFFSLPEDEEEYLTKEFSSVYEDAQCERLSNMSKNELIQEYLLLEAKYDNLVKRTERSKFKYVEEDSFGTIKENSLSDKESMVTEKDTSATSTETNEEVSVVEVMQRMKDQENQIRELQVANENLKIENDHLRQRIHSLSSEDSESDSSSTSVSSSSNSSRSASPVNTVTDIDNITVNGHNQQTNGHCNGLEALEETPTVNGIHDPDEN